MAEHKCDLTHLRHDPSHCLAPGLFRSLKRGERKKLKLDVTYEFGGDQRIEFSGPEPLGADDLRVLQGLVAMAGPCGLVLSPEPSTESGQQLRIALEPRWEAVQQDALVVKGSYRALAREIGYANIDDSKTIRDCIERLWKVSIITQSGKKRQGFRLLSEYASDEADCKLFVALNPRIAQAVLGNAPHTRISMAEVRALTSDASRLMHQRLCGWIDPCKSGRVTLETLCSYIWPDVTSPNTMKQRRLRAKAAISELDTLGWAITEYSSGKFEVKRPAYHPGNCNLPPR